MWVHLSLLLDWVQASENLCKDFLKLEKWYGICLSVESKFWLIMAKLLGLCLEEEKLWWVESLGLSNW